MMSAAKESESAVGVFWGPEVTGGGGSSSSRARLPPLPKSASTVALPPAARIASSTSASSLTTPPVRGGDGGGASSQSSLLHVLQILHRSIQRDVTRFTRRDRAFDLPSAAVEKRYYSGAVESEDRSYFLNERAVEMQREIAHAHVSACVCPERLELVPRAVH